MEKTKIAIFPDKNETQAISFIGCLICLVSFSPERYWTVMLSNSGFERNDIET